MSTSLDDRLQRAGPKRILSLDGGGMRGMLSLGFLSQIEKVLRTQCCKDDLVLADYFDLIGGTSTGAVIAAALSLGWPVSKVKDLYLQMGAEAFSSAVPTWVPEKLRYAALFVPAARFSMTLGARQLTLGGRNPWAARFKTEPLERLLKVHLGESVSLGSQDLRTGLCIVTKNLSTGSTWPLHNNPRSRYYEDNKNIPLWKLVRASTAAPVYFMPEIINYGNGEASFIDGGVSMANNPALQLLLVATLDGYRFNWLTGEDKLLIVSVGTGTWSRKDEAEQALKSRVWNWAANVPSLLMGDATWQNQLLLHAMGTTLTPVEIDREVDSIWRQTYQDNQDILNAIRPYQLTPNPLFAYVRYNVELEPSRLDKLGFPQYANPSEAHKLREMSAAENRFVLGEIGEKAGEEQVLDKHFPIDFILGVGSREH